MPTILLAQENAECRDEFSTLLLDMFPTANLHLLDSWLGIEDAVRQMTGPAVLLTDIFWQETDRSSELLLLAESFPAVPFGIFSRYQLAGTLPSAYPLPLLAPNEELPLRLAEHWENFGDREFGPYRTSSAAGPHPLGRLYWAKHRELQRPAQMLVPPSASPFFSQAIQTLARVNHPSVYALYESVPSENRVFVAMEPVVSPSLLHLRLAGQTLPLLSCARLASTLVSVLSEMESASVPARLLDEYDYTLSPKGTPRLRNPAAFGNQLVVSLEENARHLAELLEPSLLGQPKAAPLLQILRNPTPSPAHLLRQTRDFERQLAEIRDVHVRKEEVEATAKTLRARTIRRWAIAVGSLALLGFFAISAKVVFQVFFMDLPGRLAESELAVPAGKVMLQGEVVEVGGFFLDRHEVTIGEYEKFLAAAQTNPGWSRWVPEPARAKKKSPADLEPRDWQEMLRRARKNDVYQQQRITRDTPVFNVDYASAATFAEWKGRRLPSMEEWLRAAGGEDQRPYPWGQLAEAAGVNLGMQRSETDRKDSADSFFNAAPGESFPRDRGPFGHLDLGGNLSEWAVGPGQKPVAMGGNFTDPEAIPLVRSRRQDRNRRDPPPESQLEVIGFRTARD